MPPHAPPHARLSAAAAAFVLIALAASPLLTFRRLDALRSASAATTVAAAPDLSDVRALFAEEVILHQLLRGGADSTAAPRYTAVRAREEAALTRLEHLAPQIGSAVPGRVAVLRQRARGRMSERTFAALLPEVHAWHDSTLDALARDAAEEYRAQAETKGLRLRIALDAHVPLVTSDPVRVRQVLGNLIANAVKYTPRGDVTVRLLGAPVGRADDPAWWYAIEVTDTGPGIAPEHQARLFEEFVRLAPDAAPGAGIGLAISHRIARALGGELAVRSAVGQGSTFVLSLPAAPVSLPAVPAPAAC